MHIRYEMHIPYEGTMHTYGFTLELITPMLTQVMKTVDGVVYEGWQLDDYTFWQLAGSYDASAQEPVLVYRWAEWDDGRMIPRQIAWIFASHEEGHHVVDWCNHHGEEALRAILHGADTTTMLGLAVL